MNRHKKQQTVKNKRSVRTRARLLGSSVRPRLSIFRSNAALYVQVIDDAKGKTLAAGSTREIKDIKTTSQSTSHGAGGEMTAGRARAFALGKLVAERAAKAGVAEVVFDRGGYQYHGRVQAVAEGAREGGLKF